ncbi:unnamed protein product [Nesidiocoris tenuis]|uniref:Uncharacterized protein n=1 Tax=Nesidiocoris tenuis TaxID=355587 RepID=A0A6H5FZC9_9HEMI|nr:unnamed protein product [Nesidiocoris tenuis]
MDAWTLKLNKNKFTFNNCYNSSSAAPVVSLSPVSRPPRPFAAAPLRDALFLAPTHSSNSGFIKTIWRRRISFVLLRTGRFYEGTGATTAGLSNFLEPSQLQHHLLRTAPDEILEDSPGGRFTATARETLAECRTEEKV